MQASLRSFGYRTRVLVALGVLALTIMACGAASSANTGTSVSGGTSGGTSSSSQHFKVGNQVKVGDTYIVTVNSVKTNGGDDVFQPKSGNTFLVVDVTIKNISSKEQDLSSILQFTLKDSTGQKYDQTIVTNTTSPDGKIEPNDQVKGQLAYEVPQAQHSYTLAFEADIISGGETIWDLTD